LISPLRWFNNLGVATPQLGEKKRFAKVTGMALAGDTIGFGKKIPHQMPTIVFTTVDSMISYGFLL
jgi:hypothetical protein